MKIITIKLSELDAAWFALGFKRGIQAMSVSKKIVEQIEEQIPQELEFYDGYTSGSYVPGRDPDACL